MVDSIYRTRSLGVAAEGLPDQYADGRAARVWQLYIGDTRSRTAEYRSWLVSLLRGQRCKTVLDVACGTGWEAHTRAVMVNLGTPDVLGLQFPEAQAPCESTRMDLLRFIRPALPSSLLEAEVKRAHTGMFYFSFQEQQGHRRLDESRVDSIMLVEEGFQVTSVDASDKMLKYALKERWNRRKEEHFDNWVIEEANWLTLSKDLQKPGVGFDAVICLGNSFSHLPGVKGDQTVHKQALENIASMVRPGGILVIDHRNYDYILKTGCAPPGKNIYYKSDLTKEITTSVLLVDNKPNMVTLDYTVQVPPEENNGNPELSQFRLSYYPHLLEPFTELLKNAVQGPCEHSVLGDFKPYTPGQQHVPCYFIHVVKKAD